jgi:demethylmenaquinone methyltransferase / 2-methoxy-6-polyprenyl-1,4-benzoquinol methylase
MYKEPHAPTIRKMFSEIAPSYDKANSILSLGIHHLWKQKLVKMSGAQLGDHVLDCATGTGDLALLFKKQVGPQGRVVATDFCEDILSHAPKKAKEQNLELEFATADVTQLPYTDASFDVSCISFGIRNVNNLNKALEELARVVRPGGRVMILEFGQIQWPVLREAYGVYAQYVLPWLGGLISGNAQAYKYLNESSQKFPCGKDFVDRALSTGRYESMTVHPLSLGIAYIYTGRVKS